VFADFIDRLIVRGENPLKVIGDGEQIRCFTWIDDIATAIAKFSFEERTRNETFNLGNPEPMTMRDLAGLIFEIGREKAAIPAGGTLRFEHMATFPDDVRVRVPSIDKATRVLSWTPRVKVREAVDRCVDQALREMGRPG
jgi:nucleoside-diphosphate-sugar epimerase